MKYIAYCVKGLENISKYEILTKIKTAKIIETRDKRIIFDATSYYEELSYLKTVDDIGVFLGKFENISSLENVTQVIESIDFIHGQKIISEFRDIDAKSFSLTISASGAAFSYHELSEFIKRQLEKKYDWCYLDRDHGNFDIRIFIDHTTLYISIRLTKDSLHHRPYKKHAKPGSLRPSIAAAMVLLATNEKKTIKVVDNFCGSGTILCEVYTADNQVYGGDIDAESVLITKKNLINLGLQNEDCIKQLDATKTKWPSHIFDYAISNLPWDKQIKTASITDLYKNSLREYSRILKPSGSICLLVSKPQLLSKYAKKLIPGSVITIISIHLLGQNPSIVLIKKYSANKQ